jgi:hypothetical protein
MPEIPLMHGGEPIGPIGSYLIVQAIMWSPKDFDSVMSHVGMVLGSGSPTELFRKTTEHLARASTGGGIAGEVFLQLLRLKVHRPRDASVNKATFIVSRDLEERRLPGGRAAPSNIDRVHAFWADFRPAAHLWGAFRIHKDAGRIPPSPDISATDFAALSSDILLCADALLSKARAVKLDFDKHPWRLPDGYPRRPYNLDVPPPTSWAIERLKDYKPPGRPKD